MGQHNASPLVVSIAALAGAVALLAIASAASAHEHVTAGDLEFVIGWGTEPPVAYQMNSITIRVEHNLQPSGSVLVTGVADNLTVTISTGTATSVKAVEEQHGIPGTYEFAIVPTRVGTYTIRIAGQINGTTFDVSADPEDVTGGLDVDFPVSDPTPKELDDNASAQQARIEALQAQVAALQAGGGGTPVTQAQLEQANAAASTATMLALVGLAAGVVGVAVGAMGMRKGKAPPPAK
jgi:hypothetical protein